uniref:D-aminoacyl-tRNA deacylase n=2 Tax=Ornithodoros turicata TaxID=34597 RepID=A0A2R5LDB5_9ACAR
MKCKVVIQQCLTAKLKVSPEEYVNIDRGIVVFVSFLEGATEGDALKTARSVLNVKLCEKGELSDSGDNGTLVSILDLPGKVLIVPQACIAGKRKGNSVQYHGLVSKEKGKELYEAFVSECKKLMSTRCTEGDSWVQCGTYGNRQVLSVETNGPFTHVFDY